MSIQRTELRRPMAGPPRAGRPARPARREAAAPPPERRYDAAEVRGGRLDPPRGVDTEAALGRLHEEGLLEHVSRPLTQDGHRTAEEELAMLKHSVDRLAGATLRPIPEEARRAPDAELRVGRPDAGPRELAEGRVYGRPRPRGPEAAPRDGGMFTMRLFSPRHDTGRVLRIGEHEIPVEEDGSILAGMPDGTVRRITINQDVMDEMVAKGQIWLNGERVKPARASDTLSVELAGAAEEPESVQSGAKTEGAEGTAARGKGDAALASRLKADLENRQRQLLDMVRDMIENQRRHGVRHGFKVDGAVAAEARRNIADDGYWGVEQTSDRIVQFAVGLSGGDPAMRDKRVAAFEQGYAEAEKKWGGALPEICQRTRRRVHEKFEELRKEQNDRNAAAE